MRKPTIERNCVCVDLSEITCFEKFRLYRQPDRVLFSLIVSFRVILQAVIVSSMAIIFEKHSFYSSLALELGAIVEL
jgi:hypothetical protein